MMTDAQVDKEIERLRKSPAVKLAKKEQRIKYKRRQYMYNLRSFEKRGNEMMKAGITMEMLESMDIEDEE